MEQYDKKVDYQDHANKMQKVKRMCTSAKVCLTSIVETKEVHGGLLGFSIELAKGVWFFERAVKVSTASISNTNDN